MIFDVNGSGTTTAVLLAARPSGRFRAADLTLGQIPLAEPGPGQVLVRNVLMSLDPSTRGRMDESEKQYTDNFTIGGPLDGWAIGIVTASADGAVPVGAAVRHRQGWRDQAVLDVTACRVVDLDLAPAPAWLSALGQTGFTAWVGLTEIGGLQPGDQVLVSAAAGGVGSMAVQFARLLGADRVIGTAGGPAKCDWLVQQLGCAAAIDHRAGDLAAALRAATPEGLDLYFDNVGGPQLVAALSRLKVGARVAMCGMMANFDAGPPPGMNHLIEVILRRLTLRGFIVRDHEAVRPEFERRVAGWLATGELIDRATVVEGLAEAPAGLEGLLNGTNTGKALVRLSPEVLGQSTDGLGQSPESIG